MASRIVAKKLEKRFGHIHAVRGIDLEVPAGQVLGFLGPNGAGKSTTMRMITGFLEPTAGTVELEGIDLADDPIAAKRTFGYLPEGAPAYPDMTVEEFLGFIAHARGFRGADAKARVERSIGRVNLQGVRRQAFETLSKNPECRLVLIRGAGPVFSAGADLEWMKSASHYTVHENEEDAYGMAEMLRRLYELPQVTIAILHGAAISTA